ncbi:TetR/AcrR family transcriptional regulator [Azospirillum doebereinerae]|uniref:TetR/AcrR family transcriptional regulator n=2 Tax=Azospirillum doebereinerae TaxID=92933 RepID=A0A3S0XL59_9PROT|nr:TetR/AcrR family transcriptional regulator [Azospirillum doebereinerae]RUQ67837.1 TetR/AcrR family transcriptional regulator [Azospirillum doebereinerae]
MMPSSSIATDTPLPGRIRRENGERILKAAELVFAEAGFAGATMADIADRAGLPKANLHYYFGTKEELYRAVLDNILRLWLSPIDAITPDADPAKALTAYVTAKLEASRTRPHASKVFANEMLHGATQIERFLAEDLRRLVDDKAAVIDGWVAAGRVAPLDARQFLFMIWAVTQHYADFDVQVRKVMGRRTLTRQDFAHITAEVLRLILRAAGLPDTPPHPSNA